jgi:hypothetical protein
LTDYVTSRPDFSFVFHGWAPATRLEQVRQYSHAMLLYGLGALMVMCSFVLERDFEAEKWTKSTDFQLQTW